MLSIDLKSLVRRVLVKFVKLKVNFAAEKAVLKH